MPNRGRLRIRKQETFILWILNGFIGIGIFRQLGRATDYMLGDERTVGLVEVPIQTAQLVWGPYFLITAIILGVGVWQQRLKVTAFGCLLSFAANVMFAVITSMEVFKIERLSEATGPFARGAHWWAHHLWDMPGIIPIDDWRYPVDYISTAAQWLLLFIALGLTNAVLHDRKERHGER